MLDDEKYYDYTISLVNSKVIEDVIDDVIEVQDSEVEEHWNILGCIALLVMFTLFCWDKGLVNFKF